MYEVFSWYLLNLKLWRKLFHDIQADILSRVFFKCICRVCIWKKITLYDNVELIPAELVSNTGVVPCACETAEGSDGMLAWKIKNIWYNATKITELDAVLDTFYDA